MVNQDDRLPQGVTWKRIWDPLLRSFHWLFAGAVILAWGLGQWGPAIMTLHYYVGYLVIGLLVFRLIWGLVGPAPPGSPISCLAPEPR